MVVDALSVGFLVFAGLFVLRACTLGFWSLLKENSPKQPDDSPIPPTKGVVRCRPRVVLGDRRLPSIALVSGSGS